MKRSTAGKYISALGLACFIAASSSSALAKPSVTFRYKHYKIRGTSIDEIKDSIKAFAPANQNGQRFSALTKYDISWNYKFDKSGNGCKIKTVNTQVVITYQLPELENVNDLNDETRNQWESYYFSLKLHEDGHAQMGITAANEIEENIAAMKPKQDCRQLSITANDLGRQIINKYDTQNVNYDQQTMHGHSQGAYLVSSN